MAGEKKEKKHLFLEWLLTVMAIFFVLAVCLSAAYWRYSEKYADKIYPGVHAGRYDLSGLTRDEAKSIMNQKTDIIHKQGIIFSHGQYRASLFPLISSVEGDLAYRIFDFDIEKNAEDAYAFGRKGGFYDNLKARLRSLLIPYRFDIYYIINEKEAEKFLNENFSRFVESAKDARLVINAADANNLKFSIEAEKIGQSIDYQKTVDLLKRNLGILDNNPIEVITDIDYPKIYESDCLNIESQAEKMLSAAPVSLAYGSDVWQVNFSHLTDWIVLRPGPGTGQEDKVVVGLDPAKGKRFISEWVAPKIDRPAQNAKFEIKDGRVAEFQASRDGLELNINESFDRLEAELREGRNRVELVVGDKKSALQTEEINNLGIKEIIGTGHSNFSGSPANRRHNIKTGANSLNGVLIKPGEEFSLITTLGNIDKEGGYLPELVIKDNKTVPEYGGGLCQIGTTMFRATLKTGLPVTMRRNHSYRVSYYEPAGTDATIYNPWPDYKFINDTGNHILIQARIEGDDLYFDFWGTRDGRKAETTEPVINNIVKPAPTKFIETLDLKPGQKKCTEHAHNGADASFDYTVTYADGKVEEKTFKSHYVPWREVCLIGVEKLSTDTATSSPEAIPR